MTSTAETIRTVIAEMREFYERAVTIDDDQFLSWIDRLEPLINTQRVEHETPVAWAHITDDGRIRMWGYTCNDADLQRLANHIGAQPVPLYTHPASTGKESLPVGTTIDRARPTNRRQKAVELLLAQGYRWQDGQWVAPTAPRDPDQPYLCDLCRVREETRVDAQGIPFCDQCWEGWQAIEQRTKGEGASNG